MQNLNDKTIILSGASKGIGAATAKHLGKAGAKLFLLARSAENLKNLTNEIRSEGGVADYAICDVSDFQQVEAAYEKCRKTFGKPNILINNAGTIDPIARLAESDPEKWIQAVDVNYKGVYFLSRLALPEMLARKSGIILNISSGAAVSHLQGWSHYCSSKAAVLSLTGCMDREYRDQGIRVMGLSPGTVATDMQRSIRESGINPVSQLSPDAHISPQWVAQAIEWLCICKTDEYLGQDFSLKTEENRQRVGLQAA